MSAKSCARSVCLVVLALLVLGLPLGGASARTEPVSPTKKGLCKQWKRAAKVVKKRPRGIYTIRYCRKHYHGMRQAGLIARQDEGSDSFRDWARSWTATVRYCHKLHWKGFSCEHPS